MPTMRLRLHCLRTLAAAIALTGCGNTTAPDAGPPNVLLLIADDLGWNDVSYDGSEIPTPNIDALAADGVVLDRFYVAPVCSPTRMGLLTGRYPVRWGMMDAAVRPWEQLGLPPEEVTLAEALRDAGYTRRVMLGKWHVGYASRRYHPLEQGFTDFFGTYNGALDYFTHDVAGQPDWHRDYDPMPLQGRYTTELVTDEAIRVIREASRDGGPFLLSVNYNAPHTPLAATDACQARFADLPDPRRRLFAAVVSCLDDGIGRILTALDEAGLRDDTLVWFLSDNGALEVSGGSNDPLRGGKLEVYEGGIRVPAIVRWPAGGLAGGRTVDAPIGYVDVLPTLARLAGASSSLPAVVDGRDVSEVLAEASPGADRDLFFFQGANLLTGADGPEQAAVLRWPWKLVRVGTGLDIDASDAGIYELFEIDRDPNETADVAAEHPEIVATLRTRMHELLALRPPGVVLSPLAPPPGWQPPLLWRIADE